MNSMHRFLADAQGLGEREVGVVASTDQLARDGHILEPTGIQLMNYRANPIVLWSHQPEEPVGACTAISVQGRALAATILFAPLGASSTADKICALVKSNVIRGVSIGFDAKDMTPLDPQQPRGGMRINTSELLEISFVSVPADTGAGVVARSHRTQAGTTALLRALPSNSAAAIARVLDSVGRPPINQKPLALMTDQERMVAYQRERTSHALTVWGLQKGEREDEAARTSTYESRQAELARLSGRYS
jgi:uncharacterized protein